MLTLYRRHSPTKCRQKSRKKRNCSCPIYVEGTLRKKKIRRSLDTRNWDNAQAIVREWEAGATPESVITFKDAKEHFIKDAENRNLHWSTFKKYKLVLRQLEEFITPRKLTLLKNIDLQTLREFMLVLKDGPLSKQKKIERLRSFFKYCEEANWIQLNPAKLLRAPKISEQPTLPFSRDEIDQLIKGASGDILTFVLLLRYSGMRISDAAMLKKESLHKDRLFLYTQKTGTPVNVPLPPNLVEQLSQMQTKEGYFFITNSIRMETVANNWRRKLKKLLRDTNIENGHPHRFRDTFAVELLLSGVPIETVSILLGHASVKITQKHYSPWIRERQVMLEMMVKKSW